MFEEVLQKGRFTLAAAARAAVIILLFSGTLVLRFSII